MSRFQQRTKTLTVHAPCCGARMTVEYDGSYTGWERVTDLPARCPKGHSLTDTFSDPEYCSDIRDDLHEYLDMRAQAGVGDISEADICGHDKAER